MCCAQSCPTLCNPMDCSLPGSSVHGISQARILEWLPFPSPKRKISSVQFSSVTQSCPTLCDPMNCSTPGLPVHYQLPEFTQTHVHQVSDDSRHPAISSSVIPFSSCPQSLQATESFPMRGGQTTGASALASFLPKKSQG